MFVQRSEFNSGYRIALYKNYLLLLLLLLSLGNSSFPHGARAGCKKTSSLLHYSRKIKFIHAFIHSFSLYIYVF